MRTAQKWDFEKRKLESVEISDKCSAYEIDMEKKVECPGCGKMIFFGNGFTSRRYHNDLGFGYSVCADCYKKELEEVLKFRKEQK